MLERLQALNPQGFVRIGLSATQRPLDEVARYLGGLWQTQHAYEPRPVTIIDAGFRKKLDLKVISPVPEFGPLDERSVWPSIYRYLYQEIDQHQSTIVFANDRSRVERITLTLNDLHQEQKKGEVEEEETPLALSHHGSVSLEARRSTEQALKDGELKAVIATGSLEMGIDMGAVDLVCQVASPGTVARGLQRVGRAGHLVGKASKGRMIPRTLADLLDQAALAREMIAGRVEECRIPSNCLDILAQQIIAMVAMDNWQIPDLLNVVRRAYPYRNLTPAALETVLEMVTGRYRFDPPTNSEVPANKPAGTLTSLQPKISWDRVHNQLKALPGSKQLALLQGGTIPDTGQYAVFSTSDVRIGELDEEFVFERRVGEVFLLGTNTWQIDQIGQDRVVVKPVTGSSAVFPFWRGEGAGRSYELGQAIGKSLKEMEKRLDKEDCLKWMEKQFHLDEPSALNLQRYLRKQMDKAGCLPNDKTIYVEASRDQLGDWQLQIFCPLGRQINLGLKLAIEANLKSRLKFRPQGFHHDDGVLIRLLDMEEPILDVFDGITPENVQKMIIDDLIDTPLFSLRFRQNATRALLMPRGGAGKRAPLWLQRLRGRDLLQVARRHPDFPIVVETYRECLEDYLHLPKLLQLFEEIATGKTRVIAKQLETPSPFASVLQLSFTMVNMYDLDSTEPDSGNSANLDSRLLEQLLAPQNPEVLLDHRAIHLVNQRLRGVGQPPRSSAEMAEWLRKLGDLTQEEVDGLKVGYLQELEQEGVAKVINISANGKKSSRWILTEEENLYGNAFRNSKKREPEWEKAAEHILHRYLGTHALVTLEEILARYPFPQQWTRQKLADWTRQGNLVSVEPRSGTQALQWSSPQILRQVQRSSLGILRRETVTATPAQFTDFLIRHQHLHPDCGLGDASGVAEVLHKLQGLGLPTELWERVILPARMPAYQTRWLDDQLDSGRWLWFCQGDVDSRVELLSFIEREKVSVYSPISSEEKISSEAEAVWECLQKRGALFALDLAQETKLNLLRVRKALWKLLRLGLVTNDRFDVLRRKEQFLEGISDTEVVTSRRQRTRPRGDRRAGRSGRSAHPD